MEFQIIRFSYVSSTQDIAKNVLRENVVILADTQQNGRGRFGRTWHSPPGGLWMSVILRPRIDSHLISLLGGVAIVSALEKFNIKACLKWPNDVLLNGKKLAGLLGEVHKGYVLLGMGINLQNEIPPELKDTAINLPEINREELLPRILEELDNMLSMEKEDILNLWREKNCTLGRKVRVREIEEYDGIARDIDEKGFLIVESEGKIRRVMAGDVEILEKL